MNISPAIVNGSAKLLVMVHIKIALELQQQFLKEVIFDTSITAINCVPGTTNQQLSYRSELASINMILTYTHIVYELHNIKEGLITICLDRKQAILHCQQGNFNSSDPGFDMLCDIQKKLKNVLIKVNSNR